MSKLDYVTVSIVAICILAIGFLVYKMTNLFQGDKPADKIETVTDSVEVEDDGVYDYEIDENVDSTGTVSKTGGAATDAAPTTKPATKPADNKEVSAGDAAAEDDAETANPGTSTTNTTTASSEKASDTGGKFMVLAGSFTKKNFADAQVKKLNKMGYDNARSEIFDRGKYAVVLVDRFDNMAAAEKLVKKLNADGVKSYVKMKAGE
ncbi:MAG: SPOR domain-containing protein [Bacteroidetes bacterium]|nr:SPOR domain-containing protein [Bacteroidota bacterium]